MENFVFTYKLTTILSNSNLISLSLLAKDAFSVNNLGKYMRCVLYWKGAKDTKG